MNFNSVFCVLVITATLSVEDSSSLSFTVEPSDQVVAVGQSLLLNCQVQHSGSGSVQVSWQNNGVWLLTPANQPWTYLMNNSLYYSSVPAQSIGSFRCGATILETSQIIYSRTAIVQAAFINPKYYTQPDNASRRLGEDATFDCVLAESLPYANIYWEKDGQTVTTGQISQFHIPRTNATSSNLLLKNILFSSSGWYGCVAVNHLLPNQLQRSRKVYLTVLPAQNMPHFNVRPTNTIAQEHQAAILQCEILGVPTPVISWTQDGQPVANTSDRYTFQNGSLYFSPTVQRSYAGQYVCTGTNAVGSVSSGPILFTVAYLDFPFVENPSNRTATIGDTVSINCSPPLSYPPQVTIHWYHNYQQISPGADVTISSGGTITFAAIKKSDEGMYFCDATNAHLQATRTSSVAYITVYVPPSFQVKPMNTNVTQGHPLMLHCQATGSPLPTVTWLKDNQPVNTSHVTILSNWSLSISTSVVQDTGTFSCVASNIAGSPVAHADVVIFVPPSVVSSPLNTTKTVGESVKFECSFDGIPKPDIQWFYSSGDSLVQLFNTVNYVLSGGVFEIKQIVKQNEGSYICRAENVAGRVQTSAYLEVQVPASLDAKLVNITVNESSTASFRCNASGDPKPTITWFKAGTQLSTGGRIVIGLDSLTILNTVASDAGQYSCNVSNGLDSHVGVAHLMVQVSPNITLFDIPRLVILGRNATLTCTVSGIPQPQITWQRNGLQISGSRVHQLGNGRFIVNNVVKEDSGIYTCTAENAAGRISSSGNLTVQVAPSPPIPISAIPQSSRVIQLLWKPGFDGHSPIIGYKLEMKKESGSYEGLEANILMTSYSVRNLDPYTAYSFRISALNAVGESLGATISNRTLEYAPSPPTNVVATPSNASAIIVTWSEPGTPNGQITWYDIRYSAVNSGNVTTKQLSTNQLPVLKAVISGLKPFTSYQFQVRAATGGGSNYMWGNFSLSTNATTNEAAPDLPPQDIQLEPLSSVSILVKWKPVPSHSANGVVRKYVVFIMATGPYRFSDARNISVYQSLNFTLRALYPWTRYNVSVQAFTVQDGPMSPWVYARTMEAVPGEPSNLTLVATSQHSITVFIAEPLPHMRNGIILGYMVFYKGTSLPLNTTYMSVNASSTSVTLMNLTVYTEYAVRVAAFTSVGLGNSSQDKTISTQEGVPGTVDHVTTTVLNHDTVTVSWLPPQSPNGQIVQYMITYNTSDGNSTGSVTTQGQLTVNLTKLTPNTTYFIFVTAKTSKGFGRQGATVNATTRTYIVRPTVVTSPPTDESTTVGVPAGTEKLVGGLSQDHIIIIIVCVAVVVLVIIIAAVFFCVVRPRKNPAGAAHTRSRMATDFRNPATTAYEMEGSRHGLQAVLDVHEEPSVADDTNYSSDSFDSDWISSGVPSPSPRPPSVMSPQYAEPAASPSPDPTPQFQLRNKRISVNSQDSLYDQPYSSVEELGGGFSSFGPPPPVAFRSNPISEEASGASGASDTDSQTNSQKRKSFTNELYKAVSDRNDLDLGEGGLDYEGHREGGMTGMENKGYDSDEALNEFLEKEALKNTDVVTSTPNAASSNNDALYAKPDKSKKKKTFRKNGLPSAPLSDSGSDRSNDQAPVNLDDLYAKPDKSKKRSRKTRDIQGDQSSEQAGKPVHEPSVVYDERTNFPAGVVAPSETAPVDKHDAKSMAESTLSSDTVTVSDLNSSDAQAPADTHDLIDLNTEDASVQEAPPPSPFTLRNKKISLGSQDSFYDEPYSNLEEIDPGYTSFGSSPLSGFSPPPPEGFQMGSADNDVAPEQEPNLADDDVAPEQEPNVADATPVAGRTSFTNQPYGVVDKPEDEAVVMEVKEIGTNQEPTAAAVETSDYDFDEALNNFPADEPTRNAEDKPRAFSSADEFDSMVLMF